MSRISQSMPDDDYMAMVRHRQGSLSGMVHVLMLESLALERCPHCGIDRPHLGRASQLQTHNVSGNARSWSIYSCSRCGGVVVAGGTKEGSRADEIYPRPATVDATLPERARAFLTDAQNSQHAPSASIMASASAVDAMLKELGLKRGKLYTRIGQAEKRHLITKDMAEWAHEVRLDANDQRHADEAAEHPTLEDAGRTLDFARALGDFLFVFPARVRRSRRPPATTKEAGPTEPAGT